MYKSILKKDQSEFAVKVISKDQILRLRMKDQLLNEIKILKLVQHEGIIKMHTYFEDELNVYLVLELGGKHLYDILKKEKKIKEAQTKEVIIFLNPIHYTFPSLLSIYSRLISISNKF